MQTAGEDEVATGVRRRLDHDSTARRGIMDTIIRERLEVLVIFLLPRLIRTQWWSTGWRGWRGWLPHGRLCTDTTEIAEE